MTDSSFYGVDIRSMALACLYCNLGKATTSFGTSTRAHPSKQVIVSVARYNLLVGGDMAHFPLEIPGNIWEEICVPVLQDDAVMVRTTTGTLRNASNVALLKTRPPTVLLAKIEAALVAQFQAAGIFPVEDSASTSSGTTSSAAGEEDAGAGDGEPIVRGEPDPLGDAIRWPEGHLRLTYPLVD